MDSKRLRKSTRDKKVSGVLAGVADYFDVDTTLIRLAFIAVVLISGVFPGVIGYFIASWVMPKDTEL